MTFEPGTYRIFARADDGIRIYFDDELLLNEWHDNSATNVYEKVVNLRDRHRFVVEYFENSGGARAEVWWTQQPESTPTSAPTATPTTTASATPTATSTTVPTPTSTSSSTPAPTETPTETPTATSEPTDAPPETAEPTPDTSAVAVSQIASTSRLAVEGSGFGSQEALTLTLKSAEDLSGDSLGVIVADERGAVSELLSVPDTWSDGSTIESGLLLVVVLRASGDEIVVPLDFLRP